MILGGGVGLLSANCGWQQGFHAGNICSQLNLHKRQGTFVANGMCGALGRQEQRLGTFAANDRYDPLPSTKYGRR